VYYRTNAAAIRPMYEWTKAFEKMWSHQLNWIKERAEARAKQAQNPQEEE
jgi:poly-beta-hydroxyalkanoate depolymerase